MRKSASQTLVFLPENPSWQSVVKPDQFEASSKISDVTPLLLSSYTTFRRHSLRLNAELAARAWVILGSLIVGVKNM